MVLQLSHRVDILERLLRRQLDADLPAALVRGWALERSRRT